MSSGVASQVNEFVPTFVSSPGNVEAPGIQDLILKLNLRRHPEGGYYVETDRDPLRVPNPFRAHDSYKTTLSSECNQYNSTRSASTSIYYLLTPGNPTGVFHRNKARTIHTLHKGRGRYVILHLDQIENGQKARVETFVVGHNINDGERLQWLVEGGKYKASFLMPDAKDGTESDGLLISEVIGNLYRNWYDPVLEVAMLMFRLQTVVPGFEFEDHDFLSAAALHDLVNTKQEKELRWLLSARA